MAVVQQQDILEAQQRLDGLLIKTPCLHSVTLSALTGANVYLKFENQQFTASFKERGALNCLLQLTEAERSGGVIAMSAGNHAQALAYHGQRLGIPTCIVMPKFTPATKVAQTRIFGAEVVLHGEQFDETRTHALSLAQTRGFTLIHPFDDPRVIAGQGTVALEALAQVPDMEVMLVPVGGGGLVSGVCLALAGQRVDIVGVQMERYAGATDAFYQRTDSVAASTKAVGTVAEGIAVKQPGSVTLPIIQEHVSDMLLVTEQQVEQAVFELLEIEKTVVEGAGAAGLAALQAHSARFAGRNVVVLLTGGNIDMMLLSSIMQRGLVRDQRLVRLMVEMPDVPGGLAKLTTRLAELDCNIIEIDHQRTFDALTAKSTLVELVVQMRGEEQAQQVLVALEQMGFSAHLVG